MKRNVITVALLLIGSTTALGQLHPPIRDMPLEPTPPVLKVSPPDAKTAEQRQALRHFLRARLLEKEMRLTDAAQAYQEAQKLDPDAVAIRRAQAILCLALDRDVEALEHCRAVIEKQPDDHEILLRYAAALHERGEIREASIALAKAIETEGIQSKPSMVLQLTYKLASNWEGLEEYQHATTAYKKVLALLDRPGMQPSPEDAEEAKRHRQDLAKTWERLARVATKAKLFDQAIHAYEQAAVKDVSRAAAMEFNLALVHKERGDPANALKHLQEYVTSQPGNVAAFELLCDLLRQLRRDHEVIPTLEAASQRDAFNQGLRFMLAGEYSRANEFKKAEAIYTRSLEEFPSEEATRGLLALYDQQGRWTDIVKRLDTNLGDPRQLPAAREMLKVLQEDGKLAVSVARAAAALPHAGQRFCYQTRRVLTTVCRHNKQLELAEHFGRLCVVDDPQPGEAYLELCRILSDAKKFAEEAVVCQEALTKQLRVPVLAFRLEMVRALGLAEKHDEAIAAAKEAQQSAATDDEKFQAGYTLAAAYVRAHQYGLATLVAEEMLKLRDDPRSQRDLHYLLASVASSRKDEARAELHLQKVLEIDPDDAVACNDLGYTWADHNKNLEEAERLIRKALELDREARRKRKGALENSSAEEDNAAYVDSLGWVLYRRGQLAAARVELERASRKSDGREDPTVWEHLGHVYNDTGERDLATAAWTRSLQLWTNSKRHEAPEKVRQMRALLEQRPR